MRQMTRLGALAACLMFGLQSASAQSDTALVVSAGPPSWHLQVNGMYSQANNGYGTWSGEDARILYSGKKVSPFASVGSQTRPNGSQTSYGLGSYINISPRMFSIVGVGMAPDNGTVLFPKLRTDAALFVAVPGVKGLLVSGGITDLRFTDSRTGGQIWSLGSILYKGRGIYSTAVRFNTDRLSGDHSKSWEGGAQWGAQGNYWVGVGVSAGNEAYRLGGVTPFDARFRNRSGSAFVSKWVTQKSGLGLRYDFENKLDVYKRNAFSLSYFVDF